MTLRYLVVPECRKFTPNKRGSKNPGIFLLQVKATSPVLSGLRPGSSHYTCTECTARCMSPDTVFGNLPTARRHIRISLSINPPSLNPVISSSATGHQRKGGGTPHCGQPLATVMLMETPQRAAVARQASRLAVIHRMMVWLTPCLASAAQMES
jgi:hypothetical protein